LDNGGVKQSIVCLDLEGVLVPEIWIAVSEKTRIKELRLTTRDVPDYDVLMKGRLKILADHNLSLADIQEVIGSVASSGGSQRVSGRASISWPGDYSFRHVRRNLPARS